MHSPQLGKGRVKWQRERKQSYTSKTKWISWAMGSSSRAPFSSFLSHVEDLLSKSHSYTFAIKLGALSSPPPSLPIAHILSIKQTEVPWLYHVRI